MGRQVLGDGELPVRRPWYPHLMPDDTEIWTRWLTLYPDVARRVWYDLHVGTPMAAASRLDPQMRAVAAGVSRKRIDVVLLTATEYVVCEIKPEARYTALGQVLVYWRLFREEFGVVEACRPGVICRALDPDCRMEFRSHGVRVWEVGDG